MPTKRNVLIVDDDLSTRNILNDTLRCKYNISEAASRIEALSMLGKAKPDLILLDMEIPDKGGIEVCRELKGNPDTRTIPIIMTTSCGEKEDIINGLNAGADDYITKPIYPSEVMARVESHLRAKGFYSILEQKDLILLLQFSETLSALRTPVTILNAIVNKMSELIGVARCSIVSVDSENNLVVKASNDLPYNKEINISIDKYPEIKKALDSKSPVVISDMKNDPLLDTVRKEITSLRFNSIVVVPIVRKESVIGTFLLRTASPLVEGVNEREVRLCQLIANISANALENAFLFESMKTAQFCLEEMAISDGLTKLYNHRHLFRRLDEEFERAKRYGESLSCIFLDIDNFKKVNDRYGHRSGDEVLMQVGQYIKEITRSSDIAARYGGEEFVILLPKTGRKAAIDLANRIHKTIREHRFETVKHGMITTSIGVSTYVDNNIDASEQLLQLADDAMYRAKTLGKDRVCQSE